MGDAPVRVGIAGDDQAHRHLIQCLADAAASSVPDLEGARTWTGGGAHAFLRTGMRPAAETAPSGRPRYRSQRHQGEPLGFAAVFVETVVALGPDADVVMVLADEDGDGSRPGSIEVAHRALDARGAKPPALGICNPTGEAWVIGLVAPSRSERAKRLDATLKKPVSTRPERLASKPGTAEHHVKRALRFLLDDANKHPKDYPSTTLKSDVIAHALGGVIDPACAKSLTGCGLAVFWDQLASVYAPMLR